MLFALFCSFLFMKALPDGIPLLYAYNYHKLTDYCGGTGMPFARVDALIEHMDVESPLRTPVSTICSGAVSLAPEIEECK